MFMPFQLDNVMWTYCFQPLIQYLRDISYNNETMYHFYM